MARKPVSTCTYQHHGTNEAEGHHGVHRFCQAAALHEGPQRQPHLNMGHFMQPKVWKAKAAGPAGGGQRIEVFGSQVALPKGSFSSTQ